MTGSSRSRLRLRLRRVVSDNRLVVVTVLAVLTVTGGWLTATAYVAPGTTTAERTVASWERTSTFDHAATVTEPNPAFETGTRLRNRSTYLVDVSPRLDVTFGLVYRATGGGRLNVSVRLDLVRRATDGDATLWEVRRPVANERTTVGPGRRVVVPATLDVPAVANGTRNLSARLGGAGEPTTALVATVRLSGRVNGQPVERRFGQRLVLDPAGDTYSVAGQRRATGSGRTTETVERRRDPGPVRTVGGPVLFGAGLAGLAAVVVARRRGGIALSSVERRRLSYLEDRDRYAEWIHTATLPPEPPDSPRLEAATLADLVDIAVDVDATVLESPDGGRFVVVHDGHQYVYDAPRPETASTDEGCATGRDRSPPRPSTPDDGEDEPAGDEERTRT
jgi:hypothetical protein